MKSKLKFKQIFAALCAAIVLFACTASSAMAETPQEKYNRLKEELAATRSQIESTKSNLNKQKQYKESLVAEKAILDEMVEVKKQEVERTEREVDYKQEQVAANRQIIYENDLLLKERLVAIYNMNNGSTLSRMLSVDSFAEFVTVSDAMQRISQNDTELLAMLSQQKALLEEEQVKIDALLAELVLQHTELLQHQEDIANNIMAADASITKAQADLQAQKQVEGDQVAALEQAQKEMRAIAGRIGGSSKGDGSQFVGGVFTWPVPGSYRITCEFGAPDPNGAGHRGLDVGAPSGTPIVATGAGQVIVTSYAHSSYGNYIVLDHGDGVKTLYAHCTQLLQNTGTQVQAGTVIATVGSTGFSTGPHLHLEVHNGGGLDNPRAWLQG